MFKSVLINPAVLKIKIFITLLFFFILNKWPVFNFDQTAEIDILPLKL